MYAKTARRSLAAVLAEAPELDDLPPAGSTVRKGERNAKLRQLADRIMMELWHRGYAVSARTPADKSPTGSRNPDEHDAWRSARLSDHISQS